MLTRAGHADAVVVGGVGGRDRFGRAQSFLGVARFERGAEERRGAGLARLRDFFGCPGGDDLSAFLSSLRTDVDDVVRAFDHLNVVLDNNERMPRFNEALENADEARDVVEVQTGRRLVKEKQRGFGFGVGEMCGQLEPLRFAPGEEAGGLPESQVAEADILERLQGSGDLGVLGELAEKFQRLGDGHFEDIVDRFAAQLHLEHMRLEALAAAGGADKRDVAEELHFDALVAETGAPLAASGIRIEAESGRTETGAFGRRGLREKIADVIPRAEINNGSRTR